MSSAKQRRLVLHFDLNKTIIMKDNSGGLNTVPYTVCNLISKLAWGKIVAKKISAKDDKEELQWQLAVDQLSTNQPPRGQDEVDDLISYKQYLDQMYPLKKRQEIPDDAERERANQENESIRRNKLENFAKAGSPGAKFKNHYEKMIKSLSLPKAAKEELGISDDGGNQQVFSAKAGSQGDLATEVGGDKSRTELSERKETTQSKAGGDAAEEDKKAVGAGSTAKEEEKGNEEFRQMMQIFGEGKYNLIPSFFRTLIYLKKAKREFAIVFRSFGGDINNAIFEFNKFCNGEHPCYSGRGGTPLVKFDDKTKGTKDLRISDRNQKALYYRYGTGSNQSKLVTGTLKRTTHEDSLDDFYSGDIEEGSVNIYSDPIEQFVAILEGLKKRSSMAIQDDYILWRDNDEAKIAGKLLLVDQADYGTQQIFFDDNINEDDVHSGVDVRDVVNGDILPSAKFLNKYVVKVESHRAILEPDYFIKLIESAEHLRDVEIERVEQGLDSEDEVNKNQDQAADWAKMQALPNEEYLMKTILPVLYQGMRVVDLERPNAPLEYLALYLLKHQDQIKLPPKPY